jgi:hypothetical protein
MMSQPFKKTGRGRLSPVALDHSARLASRVVSLCKKFGHTPLATVGSLIDEEAFLDTCLPSDFSW